MSATAPMERRLPQLDVLRGVAILLVLAAHPAIKRDPDGPPLWISDLLHRVGWTGVDLFFVLSGFLIGGLLFAELDRYGRLDVGRFLLRRALKIWPLYYVFLAFMVLKALVFGLPLARLAPFFFHGQNYLADGPELPHHLWSLAVEEHFYLALPLVLAGLGPRPSARLTFGGGMLIMATCLWLRWTTHSPLPTGLTHLRVDSLTMGVLLAYLVQFQPAVTARLARFGWVWLGLGLVVLAATQLPWPDSPARNALVPTALFLGFGGIVFGLVTREQALFRGILPRTLAWIGVVSYPAYLWHLDGPYAILQATLGKWDLSAYPIALVWSSGMLVYAGLAAGTGWAFAQLVEGPVLAWRDRMFPRRAPIVALEMVPTSCPVPSEDSGALLAGVPQVARQP